MRCNWAQDRLLLYLAGELEPQEAARIVRHLEKCTACTAMMEALAETQEQMESALPTSLEAPATLEARVMDAVRGMPPPRRGWQRLFPKRRWRARLALAFTAACLVLLSFAFGRQFNPGSVRSETPTLDMASLTDMHREPPALEMQSSEPEAVSQEMTPRMQFRVRAVNLQQEGATLVGASRSSVQGVPVAFLHYRWQGKSVSMFQMDAGKLTPPALPEMTPHQENYIAARKNGMSYVAWRTGGINCVLVSNEMPMHLLFQLACHACEKQEQL